MCHWHFVFYFGGMGGWPGGGLAGVMEAPDKPGKQDPVTWLQAPETKAPAPSHLSAADAGGPRDTPRVGPLQSPPPHSADRHRPALQALEL